jgi:hypothetical protein
MSTPHNYYGARKPAMLGRRGVPARCWPLLAADGPVVLVDWNGDMPFVLLKTILHLRDVQPESELETKNMKVPRWCNSKEETHD